MDPTTAWEHPGFASSDPDGIAVAAVKGDASLADLVLWDEATGDTIIRAFGVGGAVKFQTSAGGAGGIAWSDVSKVGSSLADLATRSAADLSSGTLASARLAGAYTGITSVGTLTALAVSGILTVGTTTTAGASAGEVVLATDKALRGVFSGSTYTLIQLDGTNVSAAVGHTSLNLILRFVDPISTTVINAKVSTGAANSAGAGFRYLRVPN